MDHYENGKFSYQKHLTIIPIFDITNGNPNGNMNDNNRPRKFPDESVYMTDVCIKRKIRNALSKIYKEQLLVEEDANLSEKILLTENNNSVTEEVESTNKSKKKSGKKKASSDNEDVHKSIMKNYIDARLFGYVYAEPNKNSNMKGPIQVTRAISVNIPNILEDKITKCTDKSKGDVIGSIYFVDYALFKCCINYNKNSIDESFSQEDLNKFIESTFRMFENDEAHNRKLILQQLIIIEHNKEQIYNNIDEFVSLKQKDKIEGKDEIKGKSFNDYELIINDEIKKIDCNLYIFDKYQNLVNSISRG